MARVLETLIASERIKFGRFTSEDQPLNTIVLNASKTYIDGIQGFHVSPVRYQGVHTSNTLVYDPVTKEILDAGRTDVLSLEGNTVITGNLIVLGETTYSTTTHLEITDRILEIGKNQDSHSPIGVQMHDASVLYDQGIISVNKPLRVSERLECPTYFGDGGNLSNITFTEITTGNICADVVTANTFIGDGGLLSNLTFHAMTLQGGETDVPITLKNKGTSLSTDGNILVGKNVSVAGRVVSSGGFVGDGSALTRVSYPQIGNTFTETIHFKNGLMGDGGLLTNVYLGRDFFDHAFHFKSNVTVDGSLVCDGSALTNITMEQVAGFGASVSVPLRFNTVDATSYTGDGGLLSNILLENMMCPETQYIGDGGLLSNVLLENMMHHDTKYIGDGGVLSNIQFVGDGGLFSNINLVNVVAQGNTVTETVNFKDVCAKRFMGDGGLLSNISLARIVSMGNTVTGTVHFKDISAVTLRGDGGLLSNITLENVVAKGNSVKETVHFKTLCAQTFVGDGGLLSNLTLENVVAKGNTVSETVHMNQVYAQTYFGDGGCLSNITLQNVCDRSNRVKDIVADRYFGDGGCLSNITMDHVAQFGNSISGDLIVQGCYLGDGGCLSNISLDKVSAVDPVVKRPLVIGSGENPKDARLTLHNQADLNGLGEVQALKISGHFLDYEHELAHINAYIKSNNGTTSGFGGGLLFKTKDPNGTVTPKMVIDANGNLGIGTTNPQHRLHVEGDISVNRVFANNIIPVRFEDSVLYFDMLHLQYATTEIVDIQTDIKDIKIDNMNNGAELKVPIRISDDQLNLLIIHKYGDELFSEKRLIKKTSLI